MQTCGRRNEIYKTDKDNSKIIDFKRQNMTAIPKYNKLLKKQ